MYLNPRKHYLQASPCKHSLDKHAKRRFSPPSTYNSRAPSVAETEGSPILGKDWQEPFSNKENNIPTETQTSTLIKMDPEMTELYEIKLEDIPRAVIKDEASERVSYRSHTAPPRYSYKHDCFIELQCAITRMRRALTSAETSGRICARELDMVKKELKGASQPEVQGIGFFTITCSEVWYEIFWLRRLIGDAFSYFEQCSKAEEAKQFRALVQQLDPDINLISTKMLMDLPLRATIKQESTHTRV